MNDNAISYCFERLHVEVARHATDDFNPFHDPRRWQQIAGNPFGATIVLGFQLAFLASDLVRRRQREAAASQRITDHGLHFCNYEFLFANALRPGEPFRVEVKPTLDGTARGGGLSNRILVRTAEGRPVLTGTQSETAAPRFLADTPPTGLPLLDRLPDRIPVPGSPYFLKRKFMNTSNGKNFALASLADPQDYFDELSERVQVPPLVTAALLSSALLEKSWREHYDFIADPVVYTRHQITIDRRLQRQLRSNERLHFLEEGPLAVPPTGGLGGTGVQQHLHRCFGLVQGSQLLLRANLYTAPLRAMRHQA